MSAVETMDEVIEEVIKSFEDDCVFDYEFDGAAHIVKSENYSVHLTAEAEEDSDEWEVYAEVKNPAGDKVDNFFDCDDSLEDLENGRFKTLFENFFENNILQYIPFTDED